MLEEVSVPKHSLNEHVSGDSPVKGQSPCSHRAAADPDSDTAEEK